MNEKKILNTLHKNFNRFGWIRKKFCQAMIKKNSHKEPSSTFNGVKGHSKGS